jgi:hypothetical protein
MFTNWPARGETMRALERIGKSLPLAKRGEKMRLKRFSLSFFNTESKQIVRLYQEVLSKNTDVSLAVQQRKTQNIIQTTPSIMQKPLK